MSVSQGSTSLSVEVLGLIPSIWDDSKVGVYSVEGTALFLATDPMLAHDFKVGFASHSIPVGGQLNTSHYLFGGLGDLLNEVRFQGMVSLGRTSHFLGRSGAWSVTRGVKEVSREQDYYFLKIFFIFCFFFSVFLARQFWIYFLCFFLSVVMQNNFLSRFVLRWHS